MKERFTNLKLNEIKFSSCRIEIEFNNKNNSVKRRQSIKRNNVDDEIEKNVEKEREKISVIKVWYEFI